MARIPLGQDFDHIWSGVRDEESGREEKQAVPILSFMSQPQPFHILQGCGILELEKFGFSGVDFFIEVPPASGNVL